MTHSAHGEDHPSVPFTTIVALENEYMQENEENDDTVDENSWEIPWDKLMLGKTVLGAGNFGEVREGVVWHKDKIVKVAIKSLKGNFKFLA